MRKFQVFNLIELTFSSESHKQHYKFLPSRMILRATWKIVEWGGETRKNLQLENCRVVGVDDLRR